MKQARMSVSPQRPPRGIPPVPSPNHTLSPRSAQSPAQLAAGAPGDIPTQDVSPSRPRSDPDQAEDAGEGDSTHMEVDS